MPRGLSMPERIALAGIGLPRPDEPPDALLLCWAGAVAGDRERALAIRTCLPFLRALEVLHAPRPPAVGPDPPPPRPRRLGGVGTLEESRIKR